MAANWRRTACEVKKNPRSNMESRMQRKHLALTMVFQRTVTTPLSLCLTLRVHPIDSAYLLLPVSSGSASLAESYAGFQPPPPQTQRADFPHWASLCVSHQGLCGRFMLTGFQLLARTTR